jgi:hypothetical protein
VHHFRLSVARRAHIQDILSLVVGYGMAALLFRAFWPARVPSPAFGVPGLAFYLWLGLAMSGPIVLLRRAPGGRAAPDPSDPGPAAGSRTWAELAWLLIGIYWIVLGLLVLPARLREFSFGDAGLFGLVPVVVALGFRLLGPAAQEPGERTAWTHSAAVSLLATWPLAWICLILLGKVFR